MVIENENFERFIEIVVDGMAAVNEEMIVKGLSAGIDFDDDWERITTRYAHNAVKVSAKLAVKSVIEILSALGAIEVDTTAFGPHLEVIQGGKNTRRTSPETSDSPDGSFP